jgi:cobalt-zinc-cadmium efflux system membrane fusion protein
MRYRMIRVSVFIGGLATAACGGGSTASGTTSTTPPAATVVGAKPEIDIATITLTADAEKRLGIETMTVTSSSPTRTRTVGAEAVVPPGLSVVLSAPVAGTLVQPTGRTALTGPIAAGAPIFGIVPVQATDRDLRATSVRENAEAEATLTLADQRLRRLEALLKEGSASARAVEEARADHAIATAAAAAAKQRMTTAGRLPLGANDQLTVDAPFDGEVLSLSAAPGQTVSAGAPLAEVARVNALWVRVPLFAGDLTTIDATKHARVAALGRESAGPWHDAPRVAGPPSADLGASSVDLYFDLSRAAGRLRPHERVSVQLALAGAANSASALTIPESAVLRDLQGGTWVYEVRAPHVYARRRVELGDASPGGVPVTRGLTANTRIVTVGAAELYGTEFYVSK